MTLMNVLEREMYTEVEAARLLRMPGGTLHYWLEGGSRSRHTYAPILREQASGSRFVTWGEFVEAGLLRQYRKDLKVPMTEMRAFIEGLREKFDVPYPLAHFKPLSSGRDLVLQAQDKAGLDPQFGLVAEVKNQFVLLPAADAFLRRVEYVDEIAVQWRPQEELRVVFDPRRRFGAPTISGVSTHALWEAVDSGEDEQGVAELYQLSLSDVRQAVVYELASQAA
jgi:uncharacterized protein (DUF433 family)